MIRRPPRSTPFPTRRSSDLEHDAQDDGFARWRMVDHVAHPSQDCQACGFRVACHRRLKRLQDRKSTRLNSSHGYISYAVFCLKKKKKPTLNNSSANTSDIIN